jgi:hypothetical protein
MLSSGGTIAAPFHSRNHSMGGLWKRAYAGFFAARHKLPLSMVKDSD